MEFLSCFAKHTESYVSFELPVVIEYFKAVNIKYAYDCVLSMFYDVPLDVNCFIYTVYNPTEHMFIDCLKQK